MGTTRGSLKHMYHTILKPIGIFLILFGLVSWMSVPAKTSDSTETFPDSTIDHLVEINVPIGRTWLSLSLGEKIALLTGYKIASQEEVQIIEARPTQPTHELQKIRLEKKDIIRYLNRHLIDNREEFIDAIDQYYSRQDHQHRPLSDAINFAHRTIVQQ